MSVKNVPGRFKGSKGLQMLTDSPNLGRFKRWLHHVFAVRAVIMAADD